MYARDFVFLTKNPIFSLKQSRIRISKIDAEINGNRHIQLYIIFK